MPPADEPLPEGCFAARPLAETAAALAEVVREFRPHVVVTYDETGGYPHPDHIRTHEVTVAALARPGRTGGPDKLYYLATLSRAWFQALHEGLVARGIESGLDTVLAELPAAPHPITTRVPCAEHFATRDRALLAHRTQVDPAHPFFGHPRDVERAVWPTEDYHLAWSRVPTDVPEDDLFAGLR